MNFGHLPGIVSVRDPAPTSGAVNEFYFYACLQLEIRYDYPAEIGLGTARNNRLMYSNLVILPGMTTTCRLHRLSLPNSQ